MTKEARELADACGGYWSEHWNYSSEDWMYAVSNGDTRKGYWEWVIEMIETKDEDVFHGGVR